MIEDVKIKYAKEIAYEKLCLREGIRTKVYKDSLGFLTVGIGHKVLTRDNLKLGDEISMDRVQSLYDNDIEPCVIAACKQALEIGCTTPHFIAALICVNFQLGTGWTKIHKKTYAKLVAGDKNGAMVEVTKSLWFKQTPKRVLDFIDAISRIPDPLKALDIPKPVKKETFCVKLAKMLRYKKGD